MADSDRDPDCVFCKIVAGEIPSTEVMSDEDTYAFLDVNPGNEGHTLVIPRTHSVDLRTIPPENLATVTLAAQKVARLLLDRLDATGVNLLNCCGPDAWQTVFHFHLHVIPRYPDDRDHLTLPWTPGRPASAESLAEVGARLTF